jgi:hypothetical protein
MVQELVDAGVPVKEASKRVVAQYGSGFPPTAKALADAFSGSSGHGRKIRQRIRARDRA